LGQSHCLLHESDVFLTDHRLKTIMGLASGYDGMRCPMTIGENKVTAVTLSNIFFHPDCTVGTEVSSVRG
jgi:hypothetical protein